MTEKLNVSVIIPTYCRAALLCEAVSSVLEQRVDGCEVIVIDDGSTDDTRDRISQFGEQVRYEYQSNQGLSVARNTGLTLARGQFVAFLDDDDWWMPGKLALQLQVLQRFPNLAGIFSDFSIYRGPDDVTRSGMRTWYEQPVDWSALMDLNVNAHEARLHSDLIDSDTTLHIGSLYKPSLDRYFVLPSTAVIRRSLVPKDLVFPDHDPICGDWEFFARLSKNAPLCFIDCDTTFNRSHDTGYRLTRTKAKKQAELRLDFLERVYVADRNFYDAHMATVNRVWKDRLALLCKLQLLDSDAGAARTTAKKFRRIGGPASIGQWLTVLASSVPGAGPTMRLARSLKRRL